MSALSITHHAPVLQRMSLEEYREARVALGDCVREIGGVYWTTRRGVFCRPLLRYEAIPPVEDAVLRKWLGGYQHVVPEGCPSNCSMGFLMLPNSRDYSISTVSHNRRRLIKAAAERFTVAPVTDPVHFCEQGHAAYVSFYRRTRYSYKAERTRKAQFADWVHATLKAPKALILGGYAEASLVAVSVSYWVQDTVIYTTFFSDTVALQKGIGELMFHALRELASQTAGVQQIFVRPYQGGNGMDQYYLIRGARLVEKPARLYLSPIARVALQFLAPRRYALLVGNRSIPSEARSEGSSLAPMPVRPGRVPPS